MKKPLGRGLEALIPKNDIRAEQVNEVKVVGNGVLELDITNIVRNDNQPRTVFDDKLLEDLADSIREKGVIQPIVVTKLDGDSKYMIVDGERRWRASALAGKKSIPAIFRKLETAKERLELALISNAQREDLNPVELARAYQKLMSEYSYRQDDLSTVMGRSRSAVANRLRLLLLPEDVLKAIEDKIITEGHGRALLAINNRSQMMDVYWEIIDKGLTVRDVERLAQKINNPAKTAGGREEIKQDINITSLQSEIESFFSLKVYIKPKGRGGVVEIKFSSDDELDKIVKKIRGEIC